MATKDITRKTVAPSGAGRPRYTNAYKLARFLKGKKDGVSRKEIMTKLGFNPSPFVQHYECFQAVQRGRYTYTGSNLDRL